jgi:hypothetical protein
MKGKIFGDDSDKPKLVHETITNRLHMGNAYYKSGHNPLVFSPVVGKHNRLKYTKL